MTEQITNISQVHQRFINVFADYTEEHSSTTKENLDALEKEKENILQALNFAFDAKDPVNLKQVLRIVKIIGKHPGGLLEARGYWTDALRCYEKGLNAAQGLKERREEGIFSYVTAMIYKKRGRFDEAEKYIYRAHELLKNLDDVEAKKNFSNVCHEMGMMALDTGDLIESERIHKENLELRLNLEYILGVAHSKHELGRIYRLTGEFDKSQKYLEEAIQISETLRENRGALIADLHDLGCLELDLAVKIQRLENPEKAKPHFVEAARHLKRSLEIARELDYKHPISTELYELGRLAGFNNQFSEADRYLSECLKIRQMLDDTYGISQVYLGQAEITFKAAVFNKNRKNFEEFERLSNKAKLLIRKSEKINKRLGKMGENFIGGIYYLRGLIAESKFQIPSAKQYFEKSYQSCKDKGIWQSELAKAKLDQLNTKKYRV